jgi:hypothetical protein
MVQHNRSGTGPGHREEVDRHDGLGIDIGETSVDAGRTHPKADFHGSFCGSVLARLWEPAVGQADRDELSRSRTAGSLSDAAGKHIESRSDYSRGAARPDSLEVHRLQSGQAGDHRPGNSPQYYRFLWNRFSRVFYVYYAHQAK